MSIDPGIKQMEEWKDKLKDDSLPNSIGELLNLTANKVPNQYACVFFEDNETLTYEELDMFSNQLANSFINLGIRKGTHVAIMIPNVKAFPLTWMALCKIGAIMVPINVNYTPHELSYVLNQSDSTVLIIDDICYGTFSEMNNNIDSIEDLLVITIGNPKNSSEINWHELLYSGDKVFIPPNPVTLSDLSNIQYTSGTTGFPKGCMLTHHYWLLMAKTASYFPNQRVKNFLVQFPFFYMEPQVELLLSFFHEGTIYVPKQASLTKFIDWIRKYNIHYCAFPEPIMKSTPPTPYDGENELRFISAYQYKGKAHIELEKRFNVVARDTFAMTEIGLGTHVPADATHMVGSGSCGLPVPFRELKIVDEDGNELDAGETGELWVSGPGMLLGYYKNHKANQSSFSGKWFRTGDLATKDEKGYFYIVGRMKEMIKRSGENISALEVESVIEEIPGIIEAAVVAVPDEIRKEEVKVYIQLAEHTTKEEISPQKIVEYCSEKLAPFKIPRYFEYVQRFPRTPSDKIAKQLLINEKKDLTINSYDRVENRWL